MYLYCIYKFCVILLTTSRCMFTVKRNRSWICQNFTEAALLPLPVGSPQKLQGSARHQEVPFDDIFYYHTQRTADSRPQTCASAHFSPYLQLCCPFYMNSISCWLIANQSEQLTDRQLASSRGQIGDSCHIHLFLIRIDLEYVTFISNCLYAQNSLVPWTCGGLCKYRCNY